MIPVGSYEAKTRLPELLRRVEAGERVIITRHGRAVALLTTPSGVPEKTAAEAIQELGVFGKGRRLGPSLTIRNLTEEGRG